MNWGCHLGFQVNDYKLRAVSIDSEVPTPFKPCRCIYEFALIATDSAFAVKRLSNPYS
jgi:hypothetical protein